jgi:hypothetical protein
MQVIFVLGPPAETSLLDTLVRPFERKKIEKLTEDVHKLCMCGGIAYQKAYQRRVNDERRPAVCAARLSM